MKKEKFEIEFILEKVSRKSLWDHLTKSLRISLWFADRVDINDKIYTFYWGNQSEQAELLNSKKYKKVRYRWLDEEDKTTFWEFRIHTIELTGSTVLELTDFATPEEKSDSIDLWDQQIVELKRTLGVSI
ncbi:MAG: START-like domain-containing protein [Massilibacteroides sp.]|nr:START-like domain-containing protein [Massilibacteroides sp.]